MYDTYQFYKITEAFKNQHLCHNLCHLVKLTTKMFFPGVWACCTKKKTWDPLSGYFYTVDNATGIFKKTCGGIKKQILW